MSFSEAFNETSSDAKPARAATVGSAKKKPKAAAAVVHSADESVELQAELARFSAAAREQRAHAPAGSPMPLAQQDNWNRLLDSVDRFLDRGPAQTASTDVIRARVAAEAELDMDARAYGDFPADVAERVLDRVTRLAVRMAEVRRLQLRPTKPVVDLEWPIDPVVVTSLYGRRMHPILHKVRQHLGVDLGAEGGQLVSAAGRGTVVRAGWNGANGVQVEIQHPGGILTRYSHLSTPLVEVGAVVDKGDPIGLAGTSGLSTGTHLHFEVWVDGKPRDPLEEMADRSHRSAVAGVPNI